MYGIVDQVRLAAARLELVRILQKDASSRATLIFAPSLAWKDSLFQRPQQLARALAREGALVFYMEPRISRKVRPFARLEDGLYLCSVPPQAFHALSHPLVYLLTWNRAYWNEFRNPQILYDYLDALDVHAGEPAQVRREHSLLLKNARLVLATAADLFQEALGTSSTVLYCPNGVDYEHFSVGRQPQMPPPPDMEPVLALDKPLIGYYGALADWFDYELYQAVAASRPSCSFILIGPDHDGSLAGSQILDLPNVHWLGPKDYEELPRYLSFFDAAAIPFKLNTITHATSPLKLFEYMAAGKPVVATPMRESLRYDGVLAAGTPEEFALKLDEALEAGRSSEFLARLDQTARSNTWRERARQILDALANPDQAGKPPEASLEERSTAAG